MSVISSQEEGENKSKKGDRANKFKGEKQLKLIRDMILTDSTQQQIYTALGITHQTWHQWRLSIPEIVETIKVAEEDKRILIRDRARRSLLQHVSGFTVEESETIYSVDSQGKETIKEVKRKVKNIAPNAQLVMYALNNLEPQHYANRNKTVIELGDGDVEDYSDEELEKMAELEQIRLAKYAQDTTNTSE